MAIPYHIPYPFEAPSVRLALVTRPRPDAAGQVPVYVRISHANTTRYVSLGLRVRPRDWNARRGEVRRSHPDAEATQTALDGVLGRAKRAALDVIATRGRRVSADDLKAAVTDAVHPPPARAAEGVIAYGMAVMEAKRAEGKIGTALVYGTALRQLAETLALDGLGDDVPLGAVTPALVRRHEARLLALGQARNYVTKSVSTLRAVLRRAAADGLPGAAEAVASAATVKLRRERTQKVRLTLDDVRAMERLVGVVSGRRADVLDWWLFSFWCGGMRFGDVAGLRWSMIEHDVGGVPIYVRWRMRKTGDSAGSPVLDVPAAVLGRWKGRHPDYVFGILSDDEEGNAEATFRRLHTMNALARKELRQLADAAKVSYVGFHGARHSLADSLRRAGVPVATISQVLGHSSIQITQAYLSGFDRTAVEDALRGLE